MKICNNARSLESKMGIQDRILQYGAGRGSVFLKFIKLALMDFIVGWN